MPQLKVALIHDYLNQYGGAEKTFEAIAELFPKAPVYTGIYTPEKVTDYINTRNIISPRSFFLKTFPKLFTFLMPLVFESFDLREYDLIISDSSCWAKGVLTKPDQIHISYMHTPPRFLYKYSVESAKRDKWYFKPIIPLLDALIRIWDFNAAQKPNFLLANSKEIKNRISKFYKRESTVIYPPVEIEFEKSNTKPKNIPEKYFLAIGRLSAYKNFDILIKAFNKLKTPLVIVGTGKEEQKLKSLASSNIVLTGRVSDPEKYWLLDNCLGLINPVEDEDFGIVPVEGMAHGKPVLVHKSGGHLETVTQNITGMFFEDLSEEKLANKIREFEKKINGGIFDENKIAKSVEKFSKDRFQKELMEYINARTT